MELRKEQERLAVLTLKEQEREEKARRLAEFKTVQVTTVHILKQEIDRKMEKGTRIHDEHVDLVKEKALAVCDKAREVASRKTPQKQHHDSPRLRNHPLSAGRDESFATAPSPDRGSSATTKAGPNALAINYCPWYLALSNSLPPDHASSSDHVIKSLSTLGKELAAVLMPSKKRDLRAVEMLCGHGCQVLSTATSFPAATDLDHFFGRKVPSVPTTLTQLFTLVAGMGAAEAESYPCIFAFVAKLLIAAQSAPPGKASGSYQGQLPVDSVLSAIRLLATILRESVQTSQIAMRLCSSVMCIVRHALIDGSSGGYEAASKDVVSDLFGVILEEGVITLLHSTFLTIGGNASDVGYMDFIGTAIALLETVTSIMG